MLTYSIAIHTQQPIQVTPLYQAVQAASIEIPMPSSPHLRPRTPFTFQRFAIPAICQYQGRAIYLDSDMLVFRDIDEIWQQSFEQASSEDASSEEANGETMDLLSVPEPVGSARSPQYSVMLLNCDRLSWQANQLVGELERGTWTYKQFVMEMAPAAHKAAALPAGWNDLERYEPGQTALLHYTDMPRQPWLSVTNPLAFRWCDALLKAVADGAISRDTVRNSVDLGWVRPSLLHQIDRGIADPQRLPDAVLQRDRLTFTPPHVWQKYLRYPALQGGRSRQWFSRAYNTFKAIAPKTSPKTIQTTAQTAAQIVKGAGREPNSHV